MAADRASRDPSSLEHATVAELHALAVAVIAAGYTFTARRTLQRIERGELPVRAALRCAERYCGLVNRNVSAEVSTATPSVTAQPIQDFHHSDFRARSASSAPA